MHLSIPTPTNGMKWACKIQSVSEMEVCECRQGCKASLSITSDINITSVHEPPMRGERID